MDISKILHEELLQLKNDVIYRHEQARQVASGKTRSMFDEYLTSDYSGVLEGASYVGVLERGRGAGKVPYNFKDILQRWAQAKGLTFKSEADFNRWVYFVIKKIKEEGTTLYRSESNEDIFSTPISEFTDRLSSRVVSYFETEIKNQIYEHK
ncbi:MAG: hypothetical protein BGO29_14835 [Bacteroidales bacterium 36-12]|nr:MAG: hypothetical protein BGO29_14835 [Bacteroidales bacterium 36-12]